MSQPQNDLIARMESDITELQHSINGNGSEGLKTRVKILEQWRDDQVEKQKTDKAFQAQVRLMLAGVLLTVLGELALLFVKVGK